ncbi:MAG: hypothetical protein KJ905_03455 [Nanoarchaeota archaeon]|nr:hypothetical protein [Nanoarchaeota archaeon]MBU1501801.1 hypothetical protein [Nanoarchaeota archaeon]MBU2458775.1 hypothetical protein [Nanoarchaeota archaeon]
MNSETKGNALLKVLPSDFNPGVCGDYTPHKQEVCVDDPYDVAATEVCPPGGNCECLWDSSRAPGTECYMSGFGGQCTYTQEPVEGSCETDQFITISIQGIWSGNPGDPEKLECETLVTRTLECPAQIALPFFGNTSGAQFFGIVMVLVIVAMVYFVMHSGHKHKGKKRRH